MVIPVVAVVVVAVFTGGFFGVTTVATAYNYMQNNPEFCRSCHTMEKAWTRWETSEHRTVNCHDCHHTGMIEGMNLLLTFALARPEAVDTHATIQDEACAACHESGNPRWRQVAETAGHLVHSEDENIACTKCHSVTLHRFAPPGPICIVCHTEKHIEVPGMADFHCLTCHEFLAPSEKLLPTRKACLDCHLAMTEQGVTWPEHAPMQFPCGSCHKPHQQAEPTVNCLECHEDIKKKGLHQAVVHSAAKCQACHKPHGWQVTSREPCVACHADRAGHNIGIACSSCHSFAGPPQVPPGPVTESVEPTPTPTPTPTATPPAATPTEAPSASGPPGVPHTLEGRSDCTMCHGAAGSLRPVPADHEGRTSDVCLLCHEQG